MAIWQIGLWFLLWSVAGACFAQGAALTPTEKDAVGRALARPAFQSLYAGTLNAAQGDVTQARALPNPVLGLERQPLNGVLIDERQSTYSVSQRFDLGGKRGLRVDAATARLAASQSDIEARRRIAANEVRRRFHEALSTQRGVGALQDWERRMEEAEAIAQKLQKGGEVAGYDRRRVGRERATAASRVKVASAELARSMDALRGLIGVDP